MDEFYNEQYYNQELYGENNLNSSQMFMIMVGIFFLSTFGVSWFGGYFLLEPLEEEEEEEEIAYEKQYNLDECKNDGDKENIERNILLETTPQGKICIKYSNEEEGFEYWSDKSIDYKYLETAARKYVNTFSYKDLYIDRDKEMKEKIEKIKKEIDENKRIIEEGEEEEAEEEEESVFVKPKKERKQLKVKIEKNDLVADRANKYIKRGNFNDANWNKKSPKFEDKKTISYKDWFFTNNKGDKEN